MLCHDDASFTKRMNDCKEIELIGGEDLYKPVCRKCFYADQHNEGSPEKDSTEISEEGSSEKNSNKQICEDNTINLFYDSACD